MSFRRISSSLCRVARLILLPRSNTGSSSATGVSAPVRPTWIVMSRRRVSACSAMYFHAFAYFGKRDVYPAFSRNATRFSLITAPSVSNPNVSRIRSSSLIASKTSSAVRQIF